MRGFIPIVEAAYDLEGDDESWLGKLSAAAAPTLDDGLGTMAWSFRWEDDVFGIHAIAATGAAQDLKQMPVRFAEVSSAALMDRTLRATGLAVATTSERTSTEEFRAIMDACAPRTVADFIAIQALDYLGRGVVLGVPLRQVRRLSASERLARERLAVHVNAAFRLRSVLEQTPLLDSAHAEAVLANGVAVHATGPARSATARERLRAAARAVDRARVLSDTDPVAAMEAWQGLVDGRWSLVEQFDSDQRRYLVAVKNPVSCPDPRALTLQERQVAALVGTGMQNKLAAYACGITPATLANHLSSAVQKLGLESPADLVNWLSQLHPTPGDGEATGAC